MQIKLVIAIFDDTSFKNRPLRIARLIFSIMTIRRESAEVMRAFECLEHP